MGISGLDDASSAWVEGLRAEGALRQQTIERLHPVLVRIARAEASRRAGINGLAGRELDDIALQAAADALMSIVRKVEEFRGDSRFTTWAYKFVILEVSSKIARHVWRRADVQLEDTAWERLPHRLGSDPVDLAEAVELMAAVREAVAHELTPHQRRVFVALVVVGTPLDALVAELGSNRNAIYKTMFDARRKLRTYLVTHGHLEVAERRQA